MHLVSLTQWALVRVGHIYSKRLEFSAALGRVPFTGSGCSPCMFIGILLVFIFHFRGKFASVTIPKVQEIHLPHKYLPPERQMQAKMARSNVKVLYQVINS